MKLSSARIQDTISVWVVEDDEDYRESVQLVVDREDGLMCPRTFGSGEELLSYLTEHFAPDVVVMDIEMPGMDGVQAVTRLKQISNAAQAVMLTVHSDDERIFNAICAGASAYLTKRATGGEIVDAVRTVANGGVAMSPDIAKRVLNMVKQVRGPRGDFQLTPRELEVLKELTTGKTKAEVGKALSIAESTVDSHTRKIYGKLQVHTRAEAVVKALEHRLLEALD